MILLDLLEIQLTPYIPTTILGLLGLIFAYLYFYFKNKDDNKLKAIQSANPDDRIKAIEINLNELGVPINTDNLSSKQKYELLVKSLTAKTRKYLIIAIASIIIAGIVAFLIFHSNDKPQDLTGKNEILSLEILDRTAKIRELLATESKQFPDTIPDYKVVTIWTAPNDFAIQQVVSLSDVDPLKVIESLVPLLADKNVTVSSGAVIAISYILAKTSDSKKRKQLLDLIPRIEKRNFTTNLNGASMQNHDFTPLKETDIFYGAEMNAADFSDCKLDSITFKTARANYTKFVQASMQDAIFDMAHLEGAMFWGASAPRASFRIAFLKKTDFSRHTTQDKGGGVFKTSTSYIPANLEEADFGDGQLYGTNFSGARIGSAKFNGASISEVNFHDSFLLGMSSGVTQQYIQSQQPAFADDCIY